MTKKRVPCISVRNRAPNRGSSLLSSLQPVDPGRTGRTERASERATAACSADVRVPISRALMSCTIFQGTSEIQRQSISVIPSVAAVVPTRAAMS